MNNVFLTLEDIIAALQVFQAKVPDAALSIDYGSEDCITVDLAAEGLNRTDRSKVLEYEEEKLSPEDKMLLSRLGWTEEFPGWWSRAL